MHHHWDVYAYQNALRPMPPAQKLGFALGMLTLALVAYPVTQVLIVVWISLWIVGYARIPVGVYGRLVGVILLFWLSSVPALVLNVAPWGSGFLAFSAVGLGQALTVGLRSLACGVCLLFVLLTIPFAEVLQVLRRWRFPSLLLDLLLLMYRFIFLLLDEAVQMQLAQRARGGYSTWRRRLLSLGLLVSQLVVRSLRRYHLLALGLAARGLRGELRVDAPVSYKHSPRYCIEVMVGGGGLVVMEMFLRLTA